MALLTPLNVNCHASDGRKVRARPDSAAVISAPQRDQSVICVCFQLGMEGKCNILAFFCVLKSKMCSFRRRRVCLLTFRLPPGQ